MAQEKQELDTLQLCSTEHQDTDYKRDDSS